MRKWRMREHLARHTPLCLLWLPTDSDAYSVFTTIFADFKPLDVAVKVISPAFSLL